MCWDDAKMYFGRVSRRLKLRSTTSRLVRSWNVSSDRRWRSFRLKSSNFKFPSPLNAFVSIIEILFLPYFIVSKDVAPSKDPASNFVKWFLSILSVFKFFESWKAPSARFSRWMAFMTSDSMFGNCAKMFEGKFLITEEFGRKFIEVVSRCDPSMFKKFSPIVMHSDTRVTFVSSEVWTLHPFTIFGSCKRETKLK